MFTEFCVYLTTECRINEETRQDYKKAIHNDPKIIWKFNKLLQNSKSW